MQGDPHNTICASKKSQNSMFAAKMLHAGIGERKRHAPRALDITAPLNTVVAGGAKQCSVMAFLAQKNTGLVVHHAMELLSTIVDKGCAQSPITA